jgi:hypothetical protein
VKVRFQAIGRWEHEQVRTRWVPESRPRHAEIDAIIEREWEQAGARPGLQLFDGPMCRLEHYTAGKTIELDLSPVSYKVFWGTNLTNAWLGEKYGHESLANPVGLSCVVQSADGFLLLGRRNATVAYYPSRVHPFAGALEPSGNVDVFAEIRRELNEELKIEPKDIANLVCLAIIQDVSMGQPELIFSAKISSSRQELEERLDATEHVSIVAIEPDEKKLEEAAGDSAMTPVAVGTILLWGREHFGAPWFDAAQRAVNLGKS